MNIEAITRGVLAKSGSNIGLGCSRLGSVNGANAQESMELLRVALDQGIRFFDTANIYAQGDSERLLGQALGNRDDCIVCSKAGKYVPFGKRLLTPLKGVLQKVVRRSKAASQNVSSARSKPMPMNWSEPHLLASIDGSLRRLNRERIEMFMLHSPSNEDLANGEAIGALEKAQAAGKLGIIGVSPDDVDGAAAALNDSRVRCLQLPIRPGETEFEPIVERAHAMGVLVVAREILGGAAAISGATDPAEYAKDRIMEMVRRDDISVPLVGTTKLANLQASIAAAKGA